MMGKQSAIDAILNTAKHALSVQVAEFEAWVEQKHRPLARAHNRLVDRVAALEARIVALEVERRERGE